MTDAVVSLIRHSFTIGCNRGNAEALLFLADGRMRKIFIVADDNDASRTKSRGLEEYRICNRILKKMF